ncbi:MAG TPA: ComF family protein [Planctomycetota bacterium]|nr:ComF family protein [Planctomycetota bacterium]
MDAEVWKRALRRELASIASALFPPACALCGAGAESENACDAHRLRSSTAARCAKCAALLPGKIPDGNRCSACRLDPPSWSRLVALADYGEDPAARAWILALKHGGQSELARPLGAWLAECVLAAAARSEIGLADSTLVVSVPLHPARRFVRGYDQAGLVARSLARHLGLVAWRALVRTRATPPQGAPGASSRSANVRGAFAVRASMRARLAGRDVLLVDDVVTSGATANECARCLHVAGARAVVVVALARASLRAAALRAG